MATPSIISGKKSNTQITAVEETTFNQAVQDNAIAVSLSGSDNRISFTDGGAFKTVEAVAASSFSAIDRALQTIDDIASTFAAQGERVSTAGLQTANIRSELPAEVIAGGNSELFRVGIIAATIAAVAFFAFRGGA